MKLLFLDIEAAPTISYVWRLRENFISIDHIVEPGYTLCWSARWGGEKEIMFDSVYRSGARRMAKRIHALLSEADAVVTYNGKSYDIPTLQKDFLLERLPPPAPYTQIDLYQTAKQFNFVSRKLDFISKQLDLGEKVKHRGMALWTGCMHGDAASWRIMEKYNKQDVVLLEKMYKILRPWIKGHPNMALYVDADKPTCPTCGGKVQARGWAFTATNKYPRFQCKGCGKWSRGRATELSKERKASVLVAA